MCLLECNKYEHILVCKFFSSLLNCLRNVFLSHLSDALARQEDLGEAEPAAAGTDVLTLSRYNAHKENY
jgi:hypothetical protein